MIFLYYIFDIFIFNRKYRKRDFLISGLINLLIFYLLIIYFDKNILIVGFFIYTLFQNAIKYLYNFIFSYPQRVVLLSDKSEKDLESAIGKNESFSYGGWINLNEIEKIKDLKPNEVIYPIEITNQAVNEIYALKMSGIKVMDSMVFLQEFEGKISVDSISKEWVIATKGFEVLHSIFERKLKRVLDICMSLGILMIGAPFMVVTYIFVKLDNPKNFLKNPAFFRQKRIGFGGEEFEIIKFRSMKLHNPNEYSKYASEKDNRITKVGKFIRKTRLDELPQIFNVLRGEMSFVGPRPEWNELGREYEEKIKMYKVRYIVKPGLTGWAQVMYPYGASLDDAKKKLEYDIYYIKYQNLLLDMIILLKTVKVVLFGKGT